MHAADEEVKHLNGFNLSLFYNVKPWLGIGAEFLHVQGSTTVSVPPIDIDVSLHRSMLLVGPQFNFQPTQEDKVRVFGQVLFGGVHDQSKVSFAGASDRSSANAWAVKVGGGVDFRISQNASIRVEADYLPTHFGGQWQNNYQLSTGIVIGFGGK